MDLVRDVLDKKLIDRNGREIGRVDSLILEVRPDAPPRVTALEVGPAVLASRVHPILGRLMAGLEHAVGIAQGRPLRIPFSSVLQLDDEIKVDLAVEQTAAATVDRWLRSWIRSLPGA